MNKLGIVGTPQVGDCISIVQNNGDKIEGQVITWGSENWNQHWATIKIEDQYLQINISSISKYYLKKPTTKVALVNKKTNETRVINSQVGEGEPTITRRLADQQVSFNEEATGSNSHLSMNPVERARFQASQYQQRIESDRQAIHKKMTRQSVEKVKSNYAEPSFKKRT
jgi:hypothetical protein